jgi:hypothetical protein
MANERDSGSDRRWLCGDGPFGLADFGIGNVQVCVSFALVRAFGRWEENRELELRPMEALCAFVAKW